jgi:hypothetical protein
VKTTIPNSIDWERASADLEGVLTRLLGSPVGRGRRPRWPCPFHDDHDPSLGLMPSGRRCRCFVCGKSWDAIDLVCGLNPGLGRAEAARYLLGEPTPLGPARPPRPKPQPIIHQGRTSGLDAAEALALVEEAERGLWSAEGADALAYLTGPGRCLTPETIKAARLGWTTRSEAVPWRPPEMIVIPWFDGPRVQVKVRPPTEWRMRYSKENRPPKYIWARRDSASLGLYPGPEVIRPGKPLVLPEGEFERLLLAQELGDLAGVVTLGSASERPAPKILRTMLSAAPWLIATDADAAGRLAAESWLAVSASRRIRPPGSYKDWTEVRAGGVDLRRWWLDLFRGMEEPQLFTWAELESWRWGTRPPHEFDRIEAEEEAIQERIAIMIFEGGLDPEEAEKLARSTFARRDPDQTTGHH